LRKELQLLQRLAAGAVRRAATSPGDDDIVTLVAENEELRCRLRQVDGDCELAMCELEAALVQVDALDPAELQGHEAEIQAARAVLSYRNVRISPSASASADVFPSGESVIAVASDVEAVPAKVARAAPTVLEMWGGEEEVPLMALHGSAPPPEELCSY
jgi:hypothetical protein